MLIKDFVKNLTLKKVILFTVFIIGAVFIISSWSDNETVDGAGRKIANKSEKSIFSKIFSSDDKEQTTITSSNNTDPRLQNVTIDEMKTEKPDENIKDPDQLRRNKIISIITEPLVILMQKYSSFVYTGEMEVTIPTLVKDEESYNKGQRFGAGEKVVSNFVFKKDGVGNFSLYQNTSCTKEKTKYNSHLYNGTIYFYSGDYFFYNINGGEEGKKVTGKVLSTFQKDRSEPLVRRNWLQIVNDLKRLIDFKKFETEDKVDTFSVKDINKELQRKTIIVKSLSGKIDIHSVKQVMTDVTFDGENKYKAGYISGAESTFSIKMSISEIGEVKKIELP